MTATSMGVRLWLVVRQGELKDAIVAVGGTGHDATLLDDLEPALSAAVRAAGFEMRTRGRGWAKALFGKPR
jgi:hypothetical protein